MLKRSLALPLSIALFVGSSVPAVCATTNTNGSGLSDDTKPNNAQHKKVESKKKTATEAFDKGIALKKEGNIGAALLEFIKAANADPTLVEAYYQQALIFKEQKLLKLASSRLDQALAIDPQFSKGRILLATIALEQGKLDQAFDQLGKTLEKKKEKTDLASSATKNIASAQALSNVSNPKSNELPTEKKLVAKKKNKRIFRKFRRKRKQKKEKRVSRNKIRSIIARRYKKYHKRYKKPRQNRPWYANYTRFTKMLAWASPFKLHKSNENNLIDNSSPSDDLQPSPRSGMLATTGKLPTYEKNKDNKEQALDKIFQSAKVSSTDITVPIMGLEKILEPEKDLNSTTDTITKSEEPVVNPDAVPNILSPKAKLTFKPEIGAEVESEKQAIEPEIFVPPIQDKWTEKLVYLSKNGTSTLKRGEAFMFSEDTGEAVLFLQNGKRIRRIIAPKQNAERIVKMRRPDVLVPKELYYDLGLLGKVVNNQPTKTKRIYSPPKSTTRKEVAPPTFHMEKLMDESRSFIGVLRDVLRL